MKKKIIAPLLALCLILSGCLNPIPDMSEEQEETITRYAANKLLEYNKGFSTGIVDITDYVYADPDAEEEEEELQEPEQEQEEVEEEREERENADLGLDESVADDTETIDQLMSDLGLDAFELTYEGYEFTDVYPENATNGYVFYVEAADGQKLLVLNFKLNNITEATETCDLMSRNVSFAVVDNGELKTAALITMLAEDLSLCSIEIDGGDTQDVVLIFKVDEDLSESFETLILRMKYNSEVMKYKLF